MDMGSLSATNMTAHSDLYTVGFNEDHDMRCFTGLDSPNSIIKHFHWHEAREMPDEDRMRADETGSRCH